MLTEVTFGQWLRRRRKALDLTQAELAQRVGCAKVTLQKIEREERRPSRQIAARLIETLQVAPDDRAAVMQAARSALVDDPLPTLADAGAVALQLAASTAAPHPLAPLAALPAPTTPLVGRDHEVAFAHALLRQPTPRLITFTGTGGTGKTRVALEVACVSEEEFRDGIAFVALAAITDPALVGSTIGQALGLTEHGGQPIEAVLKNYLRDKHLLLVLDNFEQVLDAALLVADLLAAAPQLKILVTSREPLHLTGEQQCPVLPLAVPDVQQLPRLDTLIHYPAIELFVQRVQAVQTSFRLTESNAQFIAEVCARLEGLPLAIELAAARAKLFTPAGMLGRLRDRLTFLTGGARDLPIRQQALRNTIGWSYGLLDQYEQAVFCRLAVFVGGCSLVAADAICNAEGDLPTDIVEVLQSLLDKNLLRQAESIDGELRFTMLETIHEYALDCLTTSDELSRLRGHHADFYLALAERADFELQGPTQVVMLEQLELEHDNLRGALRWLIEQDDTERVLRLAAALWIFWHTHGHLSEGRRWLEAALAEAYKGPKALRAKALCGLGRLVMSQGEYGRSQALQQESLSLQRELGDHFGIANSLHALGLVELFRGNYSTSATYFEESLTLRRSLKDRRGISLSLTNLGVIAQNQGDWALARLRLEECLSLSKELQDTKNTALTLLNLGWVILQSPDERQLARGKFEECLALFRLLRDTKGIAYSVTALGYLAECQGEWEQAKVLHEESLTLNRILGDNHGIAWSLTNLGHVLHQQGDCDRAHAFLLESLSLLQDEGDKACLARCLEGLAAVTGTQGQPHRAVRLFGAASSLREDIIAPVWPIARTNNDRSLASVRIQLDTISFGLEWAEGKAMTLEQAIAFALNGKN